MGRPGPKSKTRPGPKSKKIQEEITEPVKNEVDSSEEEVYEKDSINSDAENGDRSRNDDPVKSEGEEEEEEDDEDDDEPPAKRGKGRSAASKKSAKGSKKAAPKSRKAPAKTKGRSKKEESEEEDKEYEVDYIVDVKNMKGQKHYLIKWKGYSKAQSTWEPEEHLNCDDEIQKFEEKREKLKNQPARNMRESRKETERYVDIAGTGDKHRRRHSRRNDSTKSPRKSYRESPDSD